MGIAVKIWDDIWRLIFLRKRVGDDTTVVRVGRDEYEVQIGSRAARVAVEMLSGSIQRLIYPQSIVEWLPEQAPVRDFERTEIIERLCAYFDQNRLTYEIDSETAKSR